MNTLFDLPIMLASIVGLAVFAFVLLDGFDLVVAALSPAFRPDSACARAISAIARSGRRRTRTRVRRLVG